MTIHNRSLTEAIRAIEERVGIPWRPEGMALVRYIPTPPETRTAVYAGPDGYVVRSWSVSDAAAMSAAP